MGPSRNRLTWVSSAFAMKRNCLTISEYFSTVTLLSSCGFTSYELPFPIQKCNYNCRIQTSPLFIFSDQGEEEFGQSLQLLANYYLSFFISLILPLCRTSSRPSQKILNQLLNFKLLKTVTWFRMCAWLSLLTATIDFLMLLGNFAIYLDILVRI